MRKLFLLTSLLAITFSVCLHSENPLDFWLMRFLQVGAPPTCSISGPDYACDNTSGIIFTGPAGMASYAWIITGAGSIPGPTNQQSVSVSSGNFPLDFNLTLTVTDANNSSSTCSKTVYNWLLKPPANITINPSPACLGVTLDLSINAASSSTVSWSGEGITNPNGNPSTTAIPASSGLKTYGVTVTTDQGCTNSGTASVTVGPVINLSTSVTNTCQGRSSGAINLTVTGGTPAFTYNWTGGVTTEDRSNLAAGTYTVTVSDAGGCSKTISATVGSNPLPSASISIAPNDTICVGSTATLTASGGNAYLWSNSLTTAAITVSPPFQGIYFVTVTGANGCTATAGATVYTSTPISLNPPTIVQPTTCSSANGSITLNVSGATGYDSYQWSTPNGSGLVPTQKNQSGLTVGTYNVTVTSGYGCTATASYVLTGPGGCDCPTIGSLSASPSPACVNQNVTLTASGLVNMGSTYGIVFKSFAAPTADPYTGGTTLATVNNNQLGGGGTSATATVTFASSGTKYLYAILTPVPSAPSCRPSATTTLNVDIIPPSITCPSNATVNANASCQGTVGSYSPASLSDNCNPSPTVTQSPASSTVLTGHNATQTVTLTANDGNGNTSTCTLTVTLKDVTPPSITCPANTTVNANASCQGTVGSYSPASLSDNCNPSPTVTQSPASSTVLNGHNTAQTVTLTANDGNGNTSTCTLTVTLKDVTPPSITCPANSTINANASCQATLGFYPPASLTDNCNPNSTASQDPGPGVVLTGHNASQVFTLVAFDNNGNTSSCTHVVTLKDVTPPTLTCPTNVTVAANASCQGTIGSYSPTSLSDNCNPSPAVTQSPASSTVLTGHNTAQTVTLTANDGNGNTSTCTLTVTLKDVTPPSITCPANATVNANASCQGTVGSYSAATLSDNCNPTPTVTQSPASSTVLTGHNTAQTVTLTANDGNGNTSTCTLTVTLKDVTPPSITCPANATVNANASCQGAIGSYSPASLSDNCNPSPTATQSPASSTLLTGHNTAQTVTLTANDGNGNTSTCTLTVTLKDVTRPNITCPANITINANASCQGTISAFTPTALSDNCNPTPTFAQSPVAGSTISGHNAVRTVTLTATDVAGNTQTCTLTVTLKDVTPPAIVCRPFTANLDASGNVSITPANVYQSGSDNCGVVNLVSVVASSFNCSNVGNNVVTLTANDGNGNTATCNAIVTVRDVTPPVAKCKTTILPANLGPNGTVTISAATVNNGSTDNCSMTFTLSPNTFNCSQIGVRTVTLTATDPGGNTSTCTGRVNVRDVSAPVAKCKTINVFLDNNGYASITASAVDNGSTDNCGIATRTVFPFEFDCSQANGTPVPVVLTLKDNYNNQSTCIANVNVKDNIAPTAVCEDVTVAIGSNGYAIVYGADLAFGSFDNCVVTSYSPVAKVYTTPNTYNLTITVKDLSNNSSTCVSVVTVVNAGNGDFQQGGGGKGVSPGVFDLLVYPNPTSGEAIMAFQLPAEQQFSYRLFDISGRMIYSQENMGIEGENVVPLRLENLTPGIYLIDFQSDTWKVQKRLVLQK